MREFNPKNTTEIIIEMVQILVIQIVVKKQLEYEKKCKKRKDKTDTTSSIQEQMMHLMLYDNDGDAGNQLGLINSMYGANNNRNTNNINDNNSTKNQNNNKNYNHDVNNDYDNCQQWEKNKKMKIPTNKHYKYLNSKLKSNNMNNNENNINNNNNNKRRNNRANRSAVAMCANKTDDNNEETYTLNYDHIDVIKRGGVSNTANDVHVDLSNVICHNGVAPNTDLTNNAIKTNTYATRVSKTIENTYGEYNSNTYSIKVALGLKDRLTNNNEVSLYADYSNNINTNNKNNSDIKGKYSNNDSAVPKSAIAETLRQLNGGYSVYIDFDAEIDARIVAIPVSSHNTTRTTRTHTVNTINALIKRYLAVVI